MTTRSQVSVYRTNGPMETIATIDLKHGICRNLMEFMKVCD